MNNVYPQKTSSLWFFRSDSNITLDPIANNMRLLFSYFNDWKTHIHQTKNINTKKKKRLHSQITCYNCETSSDIFNSYSTSASYNICSNCYFNY